jgi:D-alanyl-lipoteichoic acid acyltransferase DltB (MBOAT superfamily)
MMFNYFFAVKQGIGFSYSQVHFNINSFIIALGLSFYSLQNISYLTEIYFKRLKPENSVKNFLLYNSFFPRIASGPVMLPNEFIPQIDRNEISREMLVSGFNRVLQGLFKKMVIADRIAPAVHSVFDFGDTYHGLTTIAAIYLFTLQLYFDFSGYSDIALGAGRMLGYNLKENFNFPLRSISISEFWRRWHISLISWFTNYIYYPFVYTLRRYKKAAAFGGIAITFFISGIWHGIGLTFLLWAACHIFYLGIELLTRPFREKHFHKPGSQVFKILMIFIVFNAVCFSNIFFRSESTGRAFELIRNAGSNLLPNDWLAEFLAPLAIGGHQADEFNFYISILLMLVFLIFERSITNRALSSMASIGYISILLLLIFIFGVFNSGEQFIYMQF